MRARTIFVLLAVVSASLAASAQATWREFSSTEGRFTALFPGTPADATNGRVRTFKVIAGDSIYAVSYMDLAGQADDAPDSIFDAVRDATLQDNKLLGEEPAPLQGYPGRLVRMRSNDGRFLTSARFLWVDKARLYSVVFSGKSSDADNANKFLYAFRLAPGATAPAGNWQQFASPEGRFKVLFPGTPQQSAEPASSTQLHLFKARLGDSVYMVGYVDMPGHAQDTPDSILDAVRDALLENSSLLGEEPAPLQGQPGRLVRAKSADDSAFTRVRFLWVDKSRIYDVAVTTTGAPDADAANVQKFMGSFTLLTEAEAKALSGPGETPAPTPGEGPAASAAGERWTQLDAETDKLYDQGRYAEAAALAQQSLALAESAFPPDDTRIAKSCSFLGSLYRFLGRPAEAEPLSRRALAIYEKALGPEHPGVATVLNNLAGACQEEGKYAEAEALYQRALQIREKQLGPNDTEVAHTLNDLAGLFVLEGRHADAVPLYQRALSIDEKALAPDDPALATDVGNLAELYDEQGKYAEAEVLYQRALGIHEKVSGPQSRNVIVDLMNLGNLRQEQGRYAEAESTFQRAASLAEKVEGPQHPDLAAALKGLALVYAAEGKDHAAEQLDQRALSIYEKALGPNHPDVALMLNNLAVLCVDQGKYAQAETLSQRAIHIRETAVGPEDPLLAGYLNNLASTYERERRYEQAEALYERALRITEKAFGPDNPQLALTLGNLSNLYAKEQRYREAESLSLRALAIDQKALGPEHESLATALNNLAVLYKDEGRYAEAQPLSQRALAIMEKALGAEHPRLAGLLFNLADLLAVQGLAQQAQPYWGRGFDVLFRQFQYHFAYMSEKERLAFLATVADDFPGYFSFVHQFREKDPDLPGRMYDLLLWQKGFIAGSETALRRQVEASGDPGALKLLDQLAAKRAQIAALLNAQPKDREAWRQHIEQLESEANDLEKALVARSAAFAQQKQLERVTWQQVRDALKPGQAAVEFARFDFYDGKKWTDKTYYVALVVTPETRDQPAYIVLGEGKDLEGAPLVEFQHGVQARGTAAAEEAVIAPGAPAYDLFWKPLEPLLAGKTRLYLSPDGALNQMPLGLIPAPDGKLLMEKYDLRLLSSTKDLLRTTPAPATNSAVLVGNPAFDLGETQQRAALQKLAAPRLDEPVLVAALAPTDRSRDQGSGATLPPLPGTGAEIQAVNSLLQQHQWQATTYTADRALEEAVKQARSPRLLHIATHGFFFADQQIRSERMGFGGDQPSGLEDPMLRSGLYFAGADRARAGQPTPEDLDDGVLTAYEATSLNLQGTELVVLSACNTGQGDVHNGEGVFGLRRALQEAGAQAVMMSLWSVPDKETQELMTVFYGKWLSGVEKHEALRQAQLEMRDRVKQRYGRDLPYYWGAFVLVGR